MKLTLKSPDSDMLADMIVKTIKLALEPLKARIDNLETRPLQKWAGTFVEGARYSEASICTKGGSLWCAMRETTAVPGQSPDWVLIVKTGSHDERPR